MLRHSYTGSQDMLDTTIFKETQIALESPPTNYDLCVWLSPELCVEIVVADTPVLERCAII